MTVTIDATGRVLIPKSLRTAFGLTPGTKVDISTYGAGIQIIPEGRTARIIEDEHGHLVADTGEVFTDEMMYALIDAGRR